MTWEQGCSLKQDGGYDAYLTKKSTAPFAYIMSCNAPAACPDNGPRFSECRSYAPGGYRIPQETAMWRQKVTRGRQDVERRPQTFLAGTSAYQGAADGALSQDALDADTALKYSEPVGGGPCRRTLMEAVSGRLQFLGNFTPQVESFQPGGVPSRCNKLAYRSNPTNAFIPGAPVPQPPQIVTGVYPPGFNGR